MDYQRSSILRYSILVIASVVCSARLDVFGVGQVFDGIVETVEAKILVPISVSNALIAYDAAQTDDERLAALSVLEPMAEEGDLDAILYVARHYTFYSLSEEDLEKSFRLYLKGTKEEDPTCLLLVGVMYGSGEAGEQSLEKALSYLDRAIVAGSIDAYKAKGKLLLAPETFDEAESLLLKASELGVEDANATLGDVYHFGEFCPVDYSAALRFYEKAMEEGNAYSAIMAGDSYRNGTSGVKDLGKAFRAFGRAKELGEIRAWNRIGVMYLYGEHVSFDVQLAAAHFRKGIEAGDRESMVWLGLAYSIPGAEFDDTEQCYLWSYVSAEMGVEIARDYNLELGAYLSSKNRLELEQKAKEIVAMLKDQS